MFWSSTELRRAYLRHCHSLTLSFPSLSCLLIPRVILLFGAAVIHLHTVSCLHTDHQSLRLCSVSLVSSCVNWKAAEPHLFALTLPTVLALFTQPCHVKWIGSPIIQPWYYPQRRICARTKFHPSPHLKLSNRGGGGELAQDRLVQ